MVRKPINHFNHWRLIFGGGFLAAWLTAWLAEETDGRRTEDGDEFDRWEWL